MIIRYEVYHKNYKAKQTKNVGFFIDFWKEIDFQRGRALAQRYYGHLIADANALFVLARQERRE